MNYKLAYAIGFHPWEDAERHAPFVERINELFAREEAGKEPPYGRALDLGCGSGVWGIHLAKRGWEVTCLDIVDKALKRAKARIESEGLTINLVKGDVTRLNSAGLESKYELILDTGTYHGLSKSQRVEMGKAIDNVSDRDSTLLLLVWDPKKRGPLPGGASREEIEKNFPAWEVAKVELAADEPEAIYKVLKANEQWYTLRRK